MGAVVQVSGTSGTFTIYPLPAAASGCIDEELDRNLLRAGGAPPQEELAEGVGAGRAGLAPDGQDALCSGLVHALHPGEVASSGILGCTIMQAGQGGWLAPSPPPPPHHPLQAVLQLLHNPHARLFVGFINAGGSEALQATQTPRRCAQVAQAQRIAMQSSQHDEG